MHLRFPPKPKSIGSHYQAFQWMRLRLLSNPSRPSSSAAIPINSATSPYLLIRSDITLFASSMSLHQTHPLYAFAFDFLIHVFTVSLPLRLSFAELIDEDPPLARLIFSQPTEYLRFFDQAAVWAHVCSRFLGIIPA